MKTFSALALTACLTVALCVASIAFAGSERTNIRGMGMARTFVAGSRGLEAVGINPANLGYPDSGTVTIGLLPFGVHVGSDIMTYGVYREYFTGVPTDSGRVGRFLTDADKQRILEGFHDDVGQVAGDVGIMPLGISLGFGSFGRFAFTVTEQASFYGHVPHGFAEFVFYGNPPGSVYDFSSMKVQAQWTREYALSFGRMIPEPLFLRSLAVGIAVKYVQGFGYYGLEHGTTTFATGTDGVLQGAIDMTTRSAGAHRIKELGDGGFTPFPGPVGTGWAIDMGATADVTSYLTAGIALTDLGWITWSDDLEMTRTDSAFAVTDPMNEDQRKGVENALRGKTVPGEDFRTALGTKLRVGVAIDMDRVPWFFDAIPGDLTLAADYNQGFSNVPGSTTRGRFSIGMEYRPWAFLPIRAGVAFGGEDRSNVALGLGFRFGFLDLEFASENLNWIFSKDDFSYVSAAFGLKVRL